MNNDQSNGKSIPHSVQSAEPDPLDGPANVRKEYIFQHSAAGKADWTRDRKFRNRLNSNNTKYLKPYLKG